MDTTTNNIRILMFPALAHGHVSPYLELSKKLSTRNFHIYFCSTPVILNQIKSKLSDHHQQLILFPSIEFVQLLLPSSPELPSHYHTTKGLPYHLVDSLTKAFDNSSPTFFNILSTLKPDLLIYDMAQPWAATLASSLNIPAVLFMPFGTNMFNPVVPQHFSSVLRSNIDNLYRIVQSLGRSCNIILFRSFREIEANYIDYASAVTSKKIVPVGPLVEDPEEEDERVDIREWLDKKEPSSVIFVSFGSQCYLSEEDREALAHGLLISNVNFIWVIRFPQGEEISKFTVEDALPHGFIEMVGDRGLIVTDWAPQKRILEHPSVGGFLSHCGWGSVLESMKSGVPIVAMPMRADQPLNASLVVEIGLGLAINRDRNWRIDRDEVGRVIKQVMVEKGGEDVRRKAREMRECIRKKGDREMDDVVDQLVQICGTRAPNCPFPFPASFINFFCDIKMLWRILLSRLQFAVTARLV